jgi:hypothetical protein
MKPYHLIWFDWDDSYFPEHKEENWSLVDYYENGIKQSDEVKIAMLSEMRDRAYHNVWSVISPRGTAVTKQFCEEMEQALQLGEDFEIHLGFIRLKEKL